MEDHSASQITTNSQVSASGNMKCPRGLQWRSHTRFIVFVVAVGIFSDLFCYALLVPVLPFVLRDRLLVPDDSLQLYVSLLLGVMAGASFLFSPVAGIITDKIGNRQKPFLVGLVALFLSTVLLSLGKTISMIVVARILQGISSAVVWVVGLAICLETVGSKGLGATIGLIFSVVNFGTEAAPVLGGVLYARTGYTGVFGLCLGIIAFDIILRLLMIEKKTANSYRQEAKSSGSPDVSDRNHTATESTPLIEDDETRQPDDFDLGSYKLPPPSTWLGCKVPILCTLRSPALIAALFIGFVQAFLIGALDSTVPLVALEYYGFNSLQTGLLFLTLGVPGLIFGPLAGWAVDRFGTRIIATLGYGYLVPVHILLCVTKPGGIGQIIVFGAILALLSLGCSAIDSPSLVEAGIVVERYHEANPDLFGETGPYAQLYGLNSMTFSAGITVGPPIAGALKDWIGYGNMNIVIAAICLSACVASWMYLGSKPQETDDSD